MSEIITLKVPYEKFQCKKDDFVATLTVVEETVRNIRPAVIVCPGGAYFFKCDREGMPVARAFAKAGMAAFLLDYSVTPNRFPAALLEVAQSILYVRQHAEQYNVNPDKIIVCGFSAGGHLAASIGTMWHQSFLWKALGTTKEMICPQGIILCYPVITTGKYTHIDSCVNLLGYENCKDLVAGNTSNQETSDVLKSVSIEKQITANTPPAFIWTTFDDDLVPMENSLLFVEAMRKEKIPVEFHLFPHGIHGLSLATRDISALPDGQDVSDAVQIWFSMALRWIEGL